MTRITAGWAPMFTARTAMHEPADIRFFDESAQRDNRDMHLGVSAGWSTVTEDVKSMTISTTEETGRLRVFLNDGLIWDGDPEQSLLADYGAALSAAEGYSNDSEISAWRKLAESALALLGVDLSAAQLAHDNQEEAGQ